MDIDEFVERSVKQNASDLHLCAGHQPMLRSHGELRPLGNMAKITVENMQWLSNKWLEPSQRAELQSKGQTDGAITLENGLRLRVNFFRQLHGLSAALRRVPARCPQLEQLHVPEIVASLTECEDGLILVTGATGSGKSTTLAAMIDHLNHTCARHIITLEDPIEFIHSSQRCLIQQRELGRHTHSFTDAVRGALREDPDVLLLGELRDADSIRLALTAAETGHLVLATLHTRNATQAVDRLVDVFPAEDKGFVRAQLAGSLRGVIAQKLMAGSNGARVALFEVLTSTLAVGNLIREGKTHQLLDILQTGSKVGMQTFEQSRLQRMASGLISPTLAGSTVSQTSFPE
ncbi:MAG: type IV pilus twitching motility protein PilT [Ewingella sp.]